MARFVCPQRIVKLFRGGAATERQKAMARTLALAWCKEQLPNLKAGDEIMMPHPDTGAYEIHDKISGPMMS